MPSPLVSSQDRWKEFFAQQGRQMPQIQRPLPQQAAPQAQGRRTPLYDRLRAMPNPPQNFWGNLMWRMAQERGQQGTQEVAREPVRTGFFGRRGRY